MDNLLEFLLKEIPSHAEDMISALNTSMEKINYARTLLSDKSIKLQNRDKLDEAIECIRANKELIKLENYLKEFLGDINVSLEDRDSSLQSTDNATQTDKEVSSEQNQDWKEIEDDDYTSDDEAEEELEDEKTDYSQYLVDKTIPYKLTEDFKNTSPYAFTFDGEKYLVDNWYEITIKVCEILYKKNSVLFRDIVGSCEIKGRKNAYLAFVNEYPARTIGVPRKLLDTNIITPLYNFIHDNQMTKALISEPSQEYLILL